MKRIILAVIATALLILYVLNVNPVATLDYENLQSDPALSHATFAGGCFWCTEAAFQELDGVEEAVSGYAGGEEENPTYQEVVSHQTGHRESLQVYYYADQISYEELLDVFWNSIDPVDADGQYADRGFSYTTAIFYQNDAEKLLAEKSKQKLEDSQKYEQPIATEIEPFTTFYPAEAFHQDFYKNSAARYKQYKNGSGRK